MSDPRYYRRPDVDGASDVNAVWGWVAAAAFVAVVLLFVFASGNTNRSAEGTGATMPPTASAPNLPAKNPPSTTGAAPTNPGPSAPAQTTPSTGAK
jgi:hypothetical protein